MKKLLITLGLSVIGFIGFSNAGILPDLEFSISGTDDTYFSNCSRYGCSYDSPDFILFSCSGNGILTINYDYFNSYGASKTINCPYVFSGYINGNLVTNINKIYRENTQSDFVIHYKSSATPSGYLSPAIDGLKSTVYQLIPYVVYIGIGVLIAVLGFYSIRWLVNWMGIKVNSVFKSKRN